nr:acetylxylan esterase [Microbacterium sp. SORGH_AS_0888]
MYRTDMPLDELRAYTPALSAPDGLDAFWADTLREARAAAAEPVVRADEGPIRELIVEDLTFTGFAGEPIRAWITRPRTDERRPAVLEYNGYGGGRGLPGERLAWAAAGYVHILMDTRGQGSAWGTGGETPDPHGSGPATPGFMTRGILDPAQYYYRRLYTDAVRLVDTALTLPFIDPDRIAVTGGSQGGGTAIAAAALHEGVAAVLPDVPFLCDFPRSVSTTPLAPFTEIVTYLSVHRAHEEQVFATLSHFDGAVLARRVTAPALFSVALMDDIVLPSSVFAAFNATASADKSIEVYGYNGHEGGGAFHWQRQARWLAERF